MVVLAPRDERIRQAARSELPLGPLDDGTPDGDLVRVAIAGDLSAFDVLARRYQQRAVHAAYRVLGHVHDAREAAQDGLLRAFESLDTLQTPERFGPWLLRIVANLSLNRRRSRNGRRLVPLDEGAEQAAADRIPRARTDALPADDALIRRERLDGVMHAIRQLPEKQRIAIVLFAVEGKPQSEIARIMDCNVQLVKWYVFQARKSLRADLAIKND